MSAQILQNDELASEASGPRLRLVAPGSSRVSVLGFAGILAALVALGMGLVMVVSTAVAAQSRELTALRREATELGYEAAALTTKLQAASSPGQLARRATELGMVPNPYPAFISLADGSIIGEPTAVSAPQPVVAEPPAPQPSAAPEPAAPEPAAAEPAAPAVEGGN